MPLTKAKPFLKWAGGKTQLLPVIDSSLPESLRREQAITYIEPFVGGGAVFFHLLQNYPNITRACINDINPRLVTTYRVIRDNPELLIELLSDLQGRFRSLVDRERQKEFYLDIRDGFNHQPLNDTEVAAYMIFLNHTCFNGLYRENSKGEFNVPFGRYENPTICDAPLLLADSRLLRNVEISLGDFQETHVFADGYTIFYLDPPYRPLGSTSNFNSYVRQAFGDREQLRLKEFFSTISEEGYMALLSNSDCPGDDGMNGFFDHLYDGFFIERVRAKRSINSNALRRGQLTELLIRNYRLRQADA